MEIQLIGSKKSQETRKIERYFRERKIRFQFVDITVRPPSPGELEKIAAAAGGFEALIDTDSKAFQKRQLQYKDYDAAEELLESPELLKVPIVRHDGGTLIRPSQTDLATIQ